MKNQHVGHMPFNDEDLGMLANMEHGHAGTNMNFGHATAAADAPVLFWDDHVAPADTPVIFTDENLQQLMAKDNLVDIAMSAFENDDLLPALPNPQPAPTLRLTDGDFERYFNTEGAGGVALPAFALAPVTPVTATTRVAASTAPRAKKSLGVKSQVPKAVSNSLAPNNLDSGAARRKISGDEAERRRVSADNTGAGKPTAASSAPRHARKRGKGKVATFTLTGKTVERVFNGTALTSYHCSDGVIRILAEEALGEAKARTAAAKETGRAVEQQPAASPKKKRKAASAGARKAMAKRPKAAHSADAGG